MNTIIFDPTMYLAFEIGRGLSTVAELPTAFRRVKPRARLVRAADCPIKWTQNPNSPGDWPWGCRLVVYGQPMDFLVRPKHDLKATALRLLPDLGDESARLSVCLRLWAGCLMGAKAIAFRTRSGPNTPDVRRDDCAIIAPMAATDPIYAAGARAAAAFKHLCHQNVSYRGVPKDSLLRPPRRRRRSSPS